MVGRQPQENVVERVEETWFLFKQVATVEAAFRVEHAVDIRNDH